MSTLEEKARLARITSQAEKHNFVIEEGLKGAAVFGLVGLGASLVLQRRSNFYRNISLPFKVFLGLMIPTAAFFTITDRAAMHADRAHALKYSVTKENELHPFQAAKSGILGYVLDNKFALLGWSWVGTVGLSLAWNFT
jgi:hypothetical protein